MAIVEFFGLLVPQEAALLIVLELVLGAVLVVSVLLAALHKGAVHHWIMLSAFVVDELVAKPLMVQRLQLGVVGEFPYEGTLMLPHILLSVAATVLGIVTIVLGFRYRTKKGWKMFMPPKGKRFHRLVGVLFLASWIASLALGVRMFFLFYG